MNENNTIAELEAQAKNTRYLINRLVMAAYGVSIDDLIRKGSENGSKENRQ